VGLLAFVSEIVDITPVLPHGQALVVVPATILGTDTMRIPNEEGANLLLDTEINHLSGGFVSHITDTPLYPATRLVPGPLQLLPMARVLLAPGLLTCKFAKLLSALPLERTDTTTRHNHGFAGIGGNSRQVDFSQVYRCVHFPRSGFNLRHYYADMQLKASVPDQCTCATVFWKFEWQDERLTTFAHR